MLIAISILSPVAIPYAIPTTKHNVLITAKVRIRLNTIFFILPPTQKCSPKAASFSFQI